MGPVRFTSKHPKFSGSHFGLPPSFNLLAELLGRIDYWAVWQVRANYYPGQKKNHPRDSWREERCSTCDIKLDQVRSAQGKSRGQSRIGLALRWSRLIEHDITCGTAFFSPRISMMVLFFLSRVVWHICTGPIGSEEGSIRLVEGPKRIECRERFAQKLFTVKVCNLRILQISKLCVNLHCILPT